MENIRGGGVIIILSRIFFIIFASYIVTLPIIASPSDNTPEVNLELKKYSDMAQKAARSNKTELLTIPQITGEEQEIIYQHLRNQLTKKIDLWQIILLDKYQIRLLWNEIFARHGYTFKDSYLRNYFSSFSWYKPKDAFFEESFSIQERENVLKLQTVENLRETGQEKAVDKPNFLKISEIEPARMKPFDNELFHLENGKVIFKRSKKTHVLKRAEGGGRLYQYETASIFDDLPLLFIHHWHLIGIEGPVSSGMTVYDANGNTTNFPNVGGDFYYAPQIDAFIVDRNEGMAGMSEGSLTIIDKKGNIRISSSFGDEQVGNGYAKYFQPLWSKNIVIWILGEITDNVVSSKSIPHARIIILDSKGSPYIDVIFNNKMVPYELNQIVLLSPQVLYISYRKNTGQALLFLDKALPFYPGMQIQYNAVQTQQSKPPVGC
jgi:hypothetical protein